MPKRHYPTHQRRHDATLLEILSGPSRTQKEIAKATGYSPSQVSRILRSPDFQERCEVVFQPISSSPLVNLRKVR
jgi:Winged helix-turn-helix DNA-binding